MGDSVQGRAGDQLVTGGSEVHLVIHEQARAAVSGDRMESALAVSQAGVAGARGLATGGA